MFSSLSTPDSICSITQGRVNFYLTLCTTPTTRVWSTIYSFHSKPSSLAYRGPEQLIVRRTLTLNAKPGSKAFKCTTVGLEKTVTSSQGVKISTDIDFEDAHADLDDYDVLIIPGGGHQPVVEANAEPIHLVKAYADLQIKDPSKERTLMSICTGAFFLAEAGVLQGMAATTHPDYYTQFEIACSKATNKGLGELTDVMEERYVVNNARFELGENLDENPYILNKRPHARQKSIARKGSNAWRESKGNARRATMRLGGLRVITSGGVTTGMDASLYLIAAMVSHESAQEMARIEQYSWQKGVTVEGIDV